jgi:O-antigen/teichoic acid export membrane protein
MLGVSALGFYQMAYLLSNLPATEITNVVSQIAFPAYAKIQNDLPKLRRAYLEIFKATMQLSFPIAGCIFVLGPDFTAIFLGEKWMPMVATMQVLAIWGLIRSSGGLAAPLFQAINKPEIATKLLLIKLILLILLIYPLTIKWGILGTALAVLINAIIISPFTHCILIHMVGGKKVDIFKIIIKPAVSTLIMACIMTIVKISIELTDQVYYFFAIVIIGIAIYSACIYLFDKESSFSKILFLAKG